MSVPYCSDREAQRLEYRTMRAAFRKKFKRRDNSQIARALKRTANGSQPFINAEVEELLLAAAERLE